MDCDYCRFVEKKREVRGLNGRLEIEHRNAHFAVDVRDCGCISYLYLDEDKLKSCTCGKFASDIQNEDELRFLIYRLRRAKRNEMSSLRGSSSGK
jgi:hypothetical protein